MKNNLKWLVGSLALVFVLASCASTAHIEKDDNADFSHYKTFSWIDRDGKKNNDLLEQKVKQEVNKELEKTAGWREVKGHPDLLLSYDLLVERAVKQTNDPIYTQPYSRLFYNPYSRRYATVFYPSQFIGYDRDQRPIKEGTVTITMVDSRTDKTVWQGWSTDEINNRNMTSKDIQSAVKAIFRKFDVAKN